MMALIYRLRVPLSSIANGRPTLAAATGEERWRFETGGDVYASPAVVGGVVYIGSKDGYVYAIAEE